MIGYWTLSNGFSASIDMIIWFWFFLLLIWYIMLIDLHIKPFLHLWNESYLVIVYNFLASSVLLRQAKFETTHKFFIYMIYIYYWFKLTIDTYGGEDLPVYLVWHSTWLWGSQVLSPVFEVPQWWIEVWSGHAVLGINWGPPTCSIPCAEPLIVPWIRTLQRLPFRLTERMFLK